jgi:innexin
MDTALLSQVQSFKITSRKHRIADDDFIDRLNHYYTTIIIILFSLIICAKQYLVGEPIQCWVPAQFTDAWEQYTENYCWVKNTYFVAPHETFPDQQDRDNREIHYYQWVPFVLALQAFLFYVPTAIWRTLNWQSGVNIRNVVQVLNENSTVDVKKRKSTVATLGQHLVQVLFRDDRNDDSVWKRMKNSFEAESYLTVVYLIMKLLFVVNIFGQFLLLDAFLGPKYHLYGYQMLKDLWQGFSWKESGHFPRVTFCDFKVRDVGHVRPYTVQCVLVVNLFNEKIYIFLWFWLVMLLLVTLGGLLSWMTWLLWPGKKMRDVKDIMAKDKKRSLTNLKSFTHYMKRDCLLVMRMVRINCGEILSRELAAAMYKEYCKQHKLLEVQQPATLPKSYLDTNSPPYSDDVIPLTYPESQA